MALVAYGPEPFVVSPLTGDAQTIADQVPRLTSDLIPVPGPRRADLALEAAGELLAQGGAGPGEVIVISDGVGETPGDGAASQASALAAARALAGAGHRVSVLAVGTPEGAPVQDSAGGFASDASGGIRLARLDREGLEALARAGEGRYVELDAGDADTRALLGGGSPVQSMVVEQQALTADQWREEGPWLLLALLPLAALAFRRGWLLPVLLLAAMLPPNPGWALDWDALWQRPDQRAARAFAAGDHAAASTDFRDPAWRAAARYRAGDYGGALGDLDGLTGSESDYNRGNALARLGQLEDAIAAYEQALEQAPDHEDAQANLELLRRLKEQQQQQDPETGGQEGQPQQDSQGEQSRPSQGDQNQGSSQGTDSRARGPRTAADRSRTTAPSPRVEARQGGTTPARGSRDKGPGLGRRSRPIRARPGRTGGPVPSRARGTWVRAPSRVSRRPTWGPTASGRARPRAGARARVRSPWARPRDARRANLI